MSRDDATLLDIAKAARLILEFKEGIDHEEFLKDRMRQSAIEHQFLVLGEAVKRLSPQFRSDHPEIPFKAIAGMRDKIIHAYDRVDLEEIWKTAETDAPELLAKLGPLLPPDKTA